MIVLCGRVPDVTSESDAIVCTRRRNPAEVERRLREERDALRQALASGRRVEGAAVPIRLEELDVSKHDPHRLVEIGGVADDLGLDRERN